MMMIRAATLVLVTLSILAVASAADQGTRWAVLVAGSDTYGNYRHQADVCHAYQILKKGGLKDENIVVFMSDDIANNPENPRPGQIFNKPGGPDVYPGVPKDYVGAQVTAHNLYAVILGNKTNVTGGSRKVVDSGPNDHIFIYYADHGGAGILEMPVGPVVMANDLNNVLKKKHASRTYKSLVFYVEACESGSMFEGLLDKGMNIYATTASNATESSFATYCDSEVFHTCLGDTYSISWLEDSDKHNSDTETLSQQYQRVKKRTAKGIGGGSSNVMQFGDIKQSADKLSVYMGSFTHSHDDNNNNNVNNRNPLLPSAVNQRDADLVHFWLKFAKAPQGSAEKSEARKQLAEVTSHRKHVDNSVEQIWKLIFGAGPQMMTMMTAVRPKGQPLVDNWDCLKSVVRIFETYCGSLSQYGKKHMRSFAHICNAGGEMMMAKASAEACPTFPSNRWSSLNRGFST